jgi:hypothetical protein
LQSITSVGESLDGERPCVECSVQIADLHGADEFVMIWRAGYDR